MTAPYRPSVLRKWWVDYEITEKRCGWGVVVWLHHGLGISGPWCRWALTEDAAHRKGKRVADRIAKRKLRETRAETVRVAEGES